MIRGESCKFFLLLDGGRPVAVSAEVAENGERAIRGSGQQHALTKTCCLEGCLQCLGLTLSFLSNMVPPGITQCQKGVDSTLLRV